MSEFDTSLSDTAPSCLVLGGLGFVGRNFVKYLCDSGQFSSIVVADKAMPMISFLSKDHEEAFASPLVKFEQADLSMDSHLDRVFAHSVDYVFNLAAETRFGLPAETYKERCTTVSHKCALRAKSSGVKRFVEVSTAQVYKSNGRVAATEDSEIEPWTQHSLAKLEAENALLNIEGLDAVILRPSTIWGPGDCSGLMPRAVCAATYARTAEVMKFLWTGDLKVNTVHVMDVCRALVKVIEPEIPKGSIFNLSDDRNTSQGDINFVLAEIFKIRTGFHGIMMSNLARLNMDGVVNGANEKHMIPWGKICEENDVSCTPLSPYMHREILSNYHLHIDGKKITTFGFSYEVKGVPLKLVQEMLDDAIKRKIFPQLDKLTG
jgi:nucleoside-diphosphate-sugar epimerase